MEESKDDESQRRLTVTCPLCFVIFCEEYTRDRHMRKVHKKDKKEKKVNHLPGTYFLCTRCNRSIKRESDFKRHMKAHEEVNIFKCEVCGKTYKYECLLTLHIEKHEEKLKGFFCDDCNAKFTRKDNLYKHRERVHGRYNINFDAAKETFTDSGGICKLCEIDFDSDFDKFAAHLARRSCKEKKEFKVNSEERFQCEICEKSYLDINSLRRHINWKHKNSEPTKFDCELCKVSYAHPSSLARHVRKMHLNHM